MVADGRRFRASPNITVQLHNEEFVRVRKAPRLESVLRVRGETWVSRLNAELHAAQTKREQPVEDGYVFHITEGGSRLRLYIVAATARAQAHERAHSSILKTMQTSGLDVKIRGTRTGRRTSSREPGDR